jgi:hypothetical protein
VAEILHFAPRAELSAEENLRAFVEMCRNELTAFGKDLPFDQNIWVVTGSINFKGKNNENRLIFSDWHSAKTGGSASMAEPFLSFAKSYIRYQHALRPSKAVASRLAALRALEVALTENGDPARPSAITSATLNRTAQLIQENYEKTTAYRVGGQLQMVAEFLSDKHLLTVPVIWRSHIKRVNDTTRVGKDFDQRRQDMLPSAEALDALARIFHMATDPSDVFTASVAAILCSAPDRINELLHLEANCEVSQVVPSTGKTAYGLRWRPSKGAEPMIKWLVGSMASVVQKALANIRKITEPARAIAKWYEDNPGKLYLPPHLAHLRGQERLSIAELDDVLFMTNGSGNTLSWCLRNDVPTVKNDGTLSVGFADVERAVLAMLPRDFPIADRERGLKYREALCVVQTYALDQVKTTSRCMMYLVSQGEIATRMGGRTSHGFTSMFDRFGFKEADGRPICIRSHQFRHYLNTLAQAGGMDQLDIAKWSGRVDVGQNEVYDHLSDRDMNAMMQRVTNENAPLVVALPSTRKASLVSRDEFGQLKLTASHTTEYGYCTHDYTMLPCQLHRDCLNCTEQICVKGEAVKEANLRQLVSETRTLLQAAELAKGEGEFGADRWVDHQKLTLTRAEQLLGILDDPQVPVGTAIQMHGIIPASRLEQALAQRRLNVHKPTVPLLAHEQEK